MPSNSHVKPICKTSSILPPIKHRECTIANLPPSVRNAWVDDPSRHLHSIVRHSFRAHSPPKCQRRPSWDGRAMDVVGNAALAPASATRHSRSSLLDACAGCFVCHRNCDWPAFPSTMRVHPPPMRVHTPRRTAYCVTTPLT